MSRNIIEKSAVTITEAETAIRKTEEGKLIFTRYRNKNGVFLIRRDRLTAAAFPDDSRVGGIYLARVANVVKNINACFVEIGPGEICFLPMKEARIPFLTNRPFDGRILEGDELPVQIVRDAQKTKQPSVTAHISLANDYFALTPDLQKAGFSAKLTKEQRNGLKSLLEEAGILCGGCLVPPESDDLGNGNMAPASNDSDLILTKSSDFPPVPEGMPAPGLIVRTRAAEFAEGTPAQLKEQFLPLWQEYITFFREASHRTCYSCLKKADTIDNLMDRILNQLIDVSEFSEIVTDDQSLYPQIEEYLKAHLPETSLRLYEDSLLSLSKLYSLDSRVEEALNVHVWLKSGGYLMIQPTEALTVIDVNSGKYEGRKEDAFLKVNLEAAEEIARQIRLRNLSGIIIVDFINMEENKSRVAVMECLKENVRRDKVKTVVVDMTPLGLVEITRKKITKPLREALSEKK